jgi:hypothetical protein
MRQLRKIFQEVQGRQVRQIFEALHRVQEKEHKADGIIKEEIGMMEKTEIMYRKAFMHAVEFGTWPEMRSTFQDYELYVEDMKAIGQPYDIKRFEKLSSIYKSLEAGNK